MRRPQTFSRSLGQMLTAFMPCFMRGLSVVGTLAMFLIGGVLVAHNFSALLHDFLHARNTGTLAGWSTSPTSLSGCFQFDCLRPRLAADESFRQALISFQIPMPFERCSDGIFRTNR